MQAQMLQRNRATLHIITSAKEVMFQPLCFSAYQQDNSKSRRRILMNFATGAISDWQQLITSLVVIWISMRRNSYIVVGEGVTLRILPHSTALAEGCSIPVLLV